MENTTYTLRKMKKQDYDKVYGLWMRIHGFAIRTIDDSRENIGRFIQRNPDTSIVACAGDEIVGTILCGHDGRRACFYHVCVDERYRKHGIGQAMAEEVLEALRKAGINKVNLVAFENNQIGNCFWQKMGWTYRQDFNYYEYVLNEKNRTEFNQ